MCSSTPLAFPPLSLHEILASRFPNLKNQIGESYASVEEHGYKFGIFEANMRRARPHQKLDPLAVYSITQFYDLTRSEFYHTFFGLNRRLRLPKDAKEALILPTNYLPTDFNWREKGVVTTVKNQGLYGSCWSFSTTGALEGANFVATVKLVSLNEQQLVDCDMKFYFLTLFTTFSSRVSRLIYLSKISANQRGWRFEIKSLIGGGGLLSL